jgi:hypothetical protein
MNRNDLSSCEPVGTNPSVVNNRSAVLKLELVDVSRAARRPAAQWINRQLKFVSGL